jgi:branched-chain amino acid transport system permease protein
VVVLLNTVSSIAISFIIASGLALILGLMGVINLWHPGLMAIGAYGALEASRNGVSPWLAPLVGAALAGFAGLIVERLLIRQLYRRPLDTILATWGLALVTWQVLALSFGRGAHSYDGPVDGLVAIGSVEYSAYRLLLVGVAFALAVALAATSRYTTVGLVARAVMANEDLAQAMGLNTLSVRRWTFVVGAALAGVAGASIAPFFPITPFMGLNYLIPAFLAVLLAGRTVIGLVLGVCVLSAGQTLAAQYIDPVLANVVVVLAAVVILRFFPNGFDTLRKVG